MTKFFKELQKVRAVGYNAGGGDWRENNGAT